MLIVGVSNPLQWRQRPPFCSDPGLFLLAERATTIAQLLAIIMEDRQAAREEHQAHLTALQQLAAAHANHNNNGGNGDEGGNQRSTLSDF